MAENGFTVAEYDAPSVRVKLFGVTFVLPNPRSRKKAVRWHDLHHVATGFGTDPTGEGEVSAWELRRGLNGLDLYVSALVTSVTGLGLAVAPRRTLNAWRASAQQPKCPTALPTLFNRDLADYDGILNMTVGELRASLGIPEHGLAQHPRQLHAAAPQSAAESTTAPR